MQTLEEYLVEDLAAGHLPDFELLPEIRDGTVYFSLAPRQVAGEIMFFKVIGNNLVSLGSRSQRLKVSRGT